MKLYNMARRSERESWATARSALVAGTAISLFACVGVELPLEGDAENGGAGDAGSTAGTDSGHQGGSAGSSTGPGGAGASGSAGRGTGGNGAVAGGTGGDRSDGGAGSGAASAEGGQAGGSASGGASSGGSSAGSSAGSAGCGAESFVDPDTLACRPYTVCGPGEAVLDEPQFDRDRTCMPCGDGRFSSIENAEWCVDCRACGTLGTEAACTSTQNTTCGQMGRVLQFGPEGYGEAAAVTVDGARNVWVMGYTFAGSNANGGRSFVQKFPSGGSAPMYDEFGSSVDLRPGGIAADNQGNIWAAGYFSGTFEGVSTGQYDAFVRKYPADGSAPVTEVFGGDGDDWATAATVDAAGNVWVAGITNGDFAGESTGSYDVFARLYAADGSPPVTHRLGAAGSDTLGGIATDAAGNLWLTAASDPASPSTSVGNYDVAVWQLRADGSTPFTDTFGDTDGDYPYGISVDHDGNVWVAGYTYLGEKVPTVWLTDIFVRKYPADGSAPVTEHFGILDESVRAVSVDTDGNVWVVGSSYCNLAGTQLDFKDPSSTYSHPLAQRSYYFSELCAPEEAGMGQRDIYVRKYPANGGTARGYQFGSFFEDYPRAAAAGTDGDIWIFGDTDGELAQPDPVNGPGRSMFLWQITR
jgi:hypothetical protein